MQAIHRKTHRLVWIIVTLLTGVALWIALTNPARKQVRQLIESSAEQPTAP